MKENNLKETLSKLLPIVLLLVGITLSGGGIRKLASLAGLEKTEAVISELTEETYRTSRGDRVARSALATYTRNGTVYTADLGGIRKGLTEGGAVTVLVDPELPENAVLPAAAGEIACTVCGGLLLAAGVVWFLPLLITVLSHREKKANATET